tara:strand:- start:196 stop:663 length:468 start_codon:yes stop_codon:yes gene_type:complete
MNDEYMTDKKLTEGSPLLQIRNTTGSNTIHIQGYGSEGNRDYGYADKFSVPQEVTEALHTYMPDTIYKSLASDNPIYFRNVLEVRKYLDGFQLRISIDDEGSNDTTSVLHGELVPPTWVLDMNKPRCDDFISWLTDNDLVKVYSVKRFVETGEEE